MRVTTGLPYTVTLMMLTASLSVGFSLRSIYPRVSMRIKSGSPVCDVLGFRRMNSARESSPRNSDAGTILDDVEETISSVLSNGIDENTNVLDLPANDREAVGVAIVLKRRLDAMKRSGDCRRCWLQQKHCVCDECPSLEAAALPKVNRLFLLTHHKEIGLVVDTAKLILSSFPSKARLVVGGIGREYQHSMGEMLDAFEGDRALVLFPSDSAVTFREIERHFDGTVKGDTDDSNDASWDVVVVDGTWQQARKLYNRYIPEGGGPQRVELSEEAVRILGAEDASGHQLRRHPVKWREVSTLEATRLLLRDMMNDSYSSFSRASSIKPWEELAKYQSIGDAAAQEQLGPPRISDKKQN